MRYVLPLVIVALVWTIGGCDGKSAKPPERRYDDQPPAESGVERQGSAPATTPVATTQPAERAPAGQTVEQGAGAGAPGAPGAGEPTTKPAPQTQPADEPVEGSSSAGELNEVDKTPYQAPVKPITTREDIEAGQEVTADDGEEDKVK